MTVLVATIGRRRPGRWPRCRPRRWDGGRGRGRRCLLPYDDRRHNNRRRLLDTVELTAGGGDQLLDVLVVVAAVGVLALHRLKLRAERGHGFLRLLGVGRILERGRGVVDDHVEGTQTVFGEPRLVGGGHRLGSPNRSPGRFRWEGRRA